ncbi:MAG: PHA/PHB synthase family protein [Thermaurantiacus sp.]
MTEVAGRAQQMMLEFWTSNAALMGDRVQLSPTVPASYDPIAHLADAWADWAKALAATDPVELARLQRQYWADALQLWSGILAGKPEEIPETANHKDKRFRAEAWSEAPVFDLVRRSYLLASHYINEGVARLEGLDESSRNQLRFQTKQFIDAMSPTNFAALNPEVMQRAQETNGQSLLAGLENLLADLSRGKLTMTDEAAFEVGRNVAVTPGKVIFQNRMFQLIHYQPMCEQVFQIPLLIAPPWINKFYILDLTPEKSFIRWALEQGLNVFVISWKQADETSGDIVLDTYVEEGFLKAMEVVRAVARAPSVHMIGYCVAGTTLAMVLAWLAAQGRAKEVTTATFFTAQTDFAEAGELKTLVDDAMIATIEQLGSSGFIDGRYLATTFNMLRPTDLIWNYVVNNYLKGQEYMAFDLLYWNSDPTNVPARWHVDYLRDLYRDNRLSCPGGLSVLGTPIDLKLVETPAYIQAGETDHIAPPESVWKITRAFAGPVRFVLAGSGHIAGVVNPPSSGKYGHWVLPEGAALPETLEAFRETAVQHKGSWWPDWIAWLTPRSGKKVKAPVPGKAKGFPPLEDAPGSYVQERVA